MQDISILDAAATPVAHVFSAVTTDGAKAELANRAASIPRGYETLVLELRKPASSTGAYRLIWGITFPVVAAVNGVDTVVSSSSSNGVINFSQDSTAQQRKNIMKITSGLFANTTVVAVGELLQPVY
jgi:hypothetical protein